MGTYIGSPWGFVRGKIGDAVGGAWKGIDWVRVRVLPTQRGTLALYYDLKAGLIPPERFSYKQFNIRRLVFQVLGWIGRTNRSNLITPVWDLLVQKRNEKKTGINKYIEMSARTLWNTIPHPDEEYNPVTNTVDMSKMLLSDGDLEGINGFTKVTYDNATGNCVFTWDDAVYKNGTATDKVYTFIYLKPIVTGDYKADGWLYGTAAIVPIAKRSDKSVVMTIPDGLGAGSNVYGYLFCRDAAGIIGFSPSVGRLGENP